MHPSNLTNREMSFISWTEDKSEYIVSLYYKYAEELKLVRVVQRELYGKYMRSGAMFDDVECEFLYMSTREMRPKTVVEVGSGVCWSTSWLLMGLQANAYGHLTSYDLREHTWRIPADLKPFWTFLVGDVLDYKLPEPIDFLLSDSNHNEPFATNFMVKTFPLVRSGGRICIHDVYALATPAHGEAIAAFRYLNSLDIKCYTTSHCFPESYREIQKARMDIGIDSDIHRSAVNSLLIFEVP